MTEPLPLPESCAMALAAIQEDPLHPAPPAEAHLAACRACSEARIAYLAQEECPDPLVSAGYFERLPGRVLRKLPARSRPRIHPLAWSAAAALLLAIGVSAFQAGKANRAPVVEASLPKAVDTAYESVISDAPFLDRDEDAAQVQTLSPEEMKALLKRLDPPPSSPR